MIRRCTTRFNRLSNKGFSLIEILVAVVVLSLGMLGIAALQMTAIRFNQSAQSRTQVTSLANDIIDKMRANPAFLASYTQAVPANATANTDVTNWKLALTNVLGANATGAIAGPNAVDQTYTISITWSDASDATEDARNGRALRTFNFSFLP